MTKEKKVNYYIIALSLIGIIVSAYLSWFKLTSTVTKCIPGLGDCGSVNSSAYSLLAGIPVAYLGLFSYVLLFGLMIYQLRNPLSIPYVSYGIFGISLAGFLFSGYLTYVEIEILHEICVYCMISAICMTILFGLSLYKIVKLLNN